MDRINPHNPEGDGAEHRARFRLAGAGSHLPTDLRDTLHELIAKELFSKQQKERDRQLILNVRDVLQKTQPDDLGQYLDQVLSSLEKKPLTLSERKLLKFLFENREKLEICFEADSTFENCGIYPAEGKIQIYGSMQITSAGDLNKRSVKLSAIDVYSQLLGALAYTHEDFAQRATAVEAPGSIEGQSASLIVSMRLHYLAAAAAVNTSLIKPENREAAFGLIGPMQSQFKSEIFALESAIPSFKGLKGPAQRFAFLHLLVARLPEQVQGELSAIDQKSTAFLDLVRDAKAAKFN